MDRLVPSIAHAQGFTKDSHRSIGLSGRARPRLLHKHSSAGLDSLEPVATPVTNALRTRQNHLNVTGGSVIRKELKPISTANASLLRVTGISPTAPRIRGRQSRQLNM